MANFTLWPLYLREGPQDPLNRRLGGSQCRSGRFGEEKISCPCRDSNSDCPALNHLTPNDPYMGRTEPLTSKRCILYIYSTNIGTEYFKHALYPPFFSLQNAICFIMLTCLVTVLFTFYIQSVLKLKKK